MKKSIAIKKEKKGLSEENLKMITRKLSTLKTPLRIRDLYLKNRTLIKSNRLLKIVSVKLEDENKIAIKYQQFDQNLARLFKTRIQNQIGWDLEQLENTLQITISAIKDLHDANLVHGDFRMNHIILDSKNYLKICDQFAYRSSDLFSAPSIFFKNVEILTMTHSFLSPESLQLVRNLKQNKVPIAACDQYLDQIMTKQNDLWAVGVIFLELALMETIHNEIYDWDDFQIDLIQLKTQIKGIQKKYPNCGEFCQIVATLLNQDKEKRQRAFYFSQQEQAEKKGCYVVEQDEQFAGFSDQKILQTSLGATYNNNNFKKTNSKGSAQNELISSIQKNLLQHFQKLKKNVFFLPTKTNKISQNEFSISNMESPTNCRVDLSQSERSDNFHNLFEEALTTMNSNPLSDLPSDRENFYPSNQQFFLLNESREQPLIKGVQKYSNHPEYGNLNPILNSSPSLNNFPPLIMGGQDNSLLKNSKVFSEHNESLVKPNQIGSISPMFTPTNHIFQKNTFESPDRNKENLDLNVFQQTLIQSSPAYYFSPMASNSSPISNNNNNNKLFQSYSNYSPSITPQPTIHISSLYNPNTQFNDQNFLHNGDALQMPIHYCTSNRWQENQNQGNQILLINGYSQPNTHKQNFINSKGRYENIDSGTLNQSEHFLIDRLQNLKQMCEKAITKSQTQCIALCSGKQEIPSPLIQAPREFDNQQNMNFNMNLNNQQTPALNQGMKKLQSPGTQGAPLTKQKSKGIPKKNEASLINKIENQTANDINWLEKLNTFDHMLKSQKTEAGYRYESILNLHPSK